MAAIAMKTIQVLSFAPIAALVALSLVGCGRPASSTASAPAAPAAATPTAPASGGREVLITANDAMKFNTLEIHAAPGEALAVTLRNDGTMPKFSMGHNWVLVGADVDLAAFVNDATTAAKYDYVPREHPERILAATKLLGPRETSTARFNAPTKPGRYPFLCTFPGHLQVGMKGHLIVE